MIRALACAGLGALAAGLAVVSGPAAAHASGAPDPARQLSCATLAGGTAGGPDVPGASAAPNLGDSALNAGVPSGSLPDRVWLRSTTDTFNRRYYFALRGGQIYFKPNVERTGTDGPWRALPVPACFAGDVQAISADDDEMLAIDSQRRIYTMDGALSDPALFNWTSRWGPLFWTGPGGTLPANPIAWSWSVLSPDEDRTWTDSAGTQHPVGGAKVSHIYLLRQGGQRITYTDPWLPNDDSYEVCGPLRGRLQSVNLSSAGSTVFVIDRFGDMYTRLYDFDISGADTVYFHYTYNDPSTPGAFPPQGADSGNATTGGAAIHLPPSPWLHQPKVPGAITDAISIFSDGPGSDHRLLRVEGLDAQGRVGVWEKEIAAPGSGSWRFVPTGLPLRGHPLTNPAFDSSSRALGPAEDLRYLGRQGGASIEVPNFNPYCSPALLHLAFAPAVGADLILHTVDGLRQSPRGRGLDQSPRSYDGVIEVPQYLLAHLDRQDPRVRDFIERNLGGRRYTSTPVEATTQVLNIDVLNAALQRTPAAPSNSTRFAGVTVISRRVALDRHGNLNIQISCPAPALDRCAGNLVARARARSRPVELGRARFDLAAGHVAGVALHVGRAGRQLLFRHRRLGVSLTIRARDDSGVQVASRARITALRSARR
jgi:hypothetical protein